MLSVIVFMPLIHRWALSSAVIHPSVCLSAFKPLAQTQCILAVVNVGEVYRFTAIGVMSLHHDLRVSAVLVSKYSPVLGWRSAGAC